MKNLKPFERKSVTFLSMIHNAYRDEEDMEPAVQKLKLEMDGDLAEDLTAMMVAIMLFCRQHAPKSVENMDLIDFSHFLNRLAIQHVFADSLNDGDIETMEE